jgi:hypothetical protein
VGDFFAGFLVSLGGLAAGVAAPTDHDREWVRALVDAGMDFDQMREWALFENRYVPERLGALAEWALSLTMLDEEE